ncbi:MAG TPA: prepilin-type N-terminal cleavage/methylation domain-containing protein, partial [Burkholderiales bacterium]|nr:prepilin-type N-terminal cleavage/methylation domain-containing protein [Burkholderiales bacterium]
MSAEFENHVIGGLGTGRGRGFTLVELVVIIAILGVMAAVIGPRFMGRDAFASRGFHDEA